LVNIYAIWCPHCQDLKKAIPDIQRDYPSVKILHLEATSKDNEEFLKSHGFETLPYTLVFDEGEFKGGDSFNGETLRELLLMLGT
jgi:thiol:disulfide interchange protein